MEALESRSVAGDRRLDAAEIEKRRRQKRSISPPLLTRGELDGRTTAAKEFDRIVSAIEADLAGGDQLSTIEHGLIEAYAGAFVILQDLNARLVLGQKIDFTQHAQSVTEMVRVATRLGLSRRARQINGPTLGELIQQDQAAERQRLAQEREQQIEEAAS